MRCPNCGTLDGRVIDSRDLDDATTVRRRRECSSCRSRYTTYERVESARLLVVKRNGTREEFDRDKLADGLARALTRRPVGKDAADDAADEIEAALRARGVNEIPSSAIGEMAMDRLRSLDHIAYIRFMSVYQSFDDIEQLKQEVDTLYEERTERAPGQTTLRLVAEDGAITPIGLRGTPRRRPTKRK
jgi:transcriptional repressor NrdR